MLAIAKKNYEDQLVTIDNYSAAFKKVTRHLNDAKQAHENNSKNKLIKCLQKAYTLLPHTQLGTRMAADIIESYLQVEAYEEVIATAEEIERQGYYIAPNSRHECFDLCRIFANKAEALDAIGEYKAASRAREKALTYHLDSSDDVDVEMLQLFSK